MPKTIPPLGRFQRSYETTLLVDRLSSCEIGEVVTYGELMELIGEDPRGKASHAMYSARRIVESEKSFVFEAVTDVGLRRLDDAGILGAIDSSRKRAHRVAHKARKRSAIIDHMKLSQSDRARHYALQAQHAMIAKATSEKRTNELIEATTKTSKPVDMTRAIEALLGKRSKDEAEVAG